MQPNPYIYLPFAFIVSPLSPLSILPWPSVFTNTYCGRVQSLEEKLFDWELPKPGPEVAAVSPRNDGKAIIRWHKVLVAQP